MKPGLNSPSQNASPPRPLKHRASPSGYGCCDRILVALFGLGFLIFSCATLFELGLCFSLDGQVCSDTKENVMGLMTVVNPAVGILLLVASLWPCIRTPIHLFIFAAMASVSSHILGAVG